MRCTQIIGLTNEAQKFLDKNCRTEPIQFCPHCKKSIKEGKIFNIYKSATNEGMFNDGPYLHKYSLKNKKVAYEVIQATPWSSGPCIFLCLEIDNKRMFKWSQKEIDNC